MTFEFSNTDRTLTIHHYDKDTGQYMNSTEEFIPAGVGLPAHSTVDSLSTPAAGNALVRVNDAWAEQVDHRGVTSYNKETKEASVVPIVGELPDELTLLAPVLDSDFWDEENNVWAYDKTKSDVVLANAERVWRNDELWKMDFAINDLIDRGLNTDFARQYRVVLRNYPQETTFPQAGYRPSIQVEEV